MSINGPVRCNVKATIIINYIHTRISKHCGVRKPLPCITERLHNPRATFARPDTALRDERGTQKRLHKQPVTDCAKLFVLSMIRSISKMWTGTFCLWSAHW